MDARAVPLVVVLALTGAACTGGGEATGASPTRAPTSAPAGDMSPGGPGGPATAVPDVLDFTAPRLGGGTIDGAQYAGAPLAIWFWAPW